MTTIYKYDLEDKSPQTIELPKNAVVLTANYQPGRGMKLWCLIDTDELLQPRDISLLETGFAIAPDTMRNNYYVNTVFRNDLVWHVFINRV